MEHCVTDPGQTHDDLLHAFRMAMRHVAATVYAVTTGHGGNRFGILATAVSSLSFDPPSLLVCVNRSASLHGPLNSADTFCVNVLGDVAVAEAEHVDAERLRAGQRAVKRGRAVYADEQ